MDQTYQKWYVSKIRNSHFEHFFRFVFNNEKKCVFEIPFPMEGIPPTISFEYELLKSRFRDEIQKGLQVIEERGFVFIEPKVVFNDQECILIKVATDGKSGAEYITRLFKTTDEEIEFFFDVFRSL